MEATAAEERERRVALMNSRKRPAPAPQTPEVGPSENGSNKKPKLEHKTQVTTPQRTPPVQSQSSTSVRSLLSSFDFRTLPAQLVTELIVASLNVMSEDVLNKAIQVCLSWLLLMMKY